MTTATMAAPGTAAALTIALEEFREFLVSVQSPRLSDAQWVRSAQERCQELQVRFADVRQAFASRSQELSGTMEEVAEGLREWSREFRDRPRKQRLRQVVERLSCRYEALIEAGRGWMDEGLLPAGPTINLKPINYSRNIFHISMGAFAIVAYELLFSWQVCVWIMLGLTLTALTLETVRRSRPRLNAFLVKRVFGAISRPREMYRVNGATWYILATLTVILAFPMRAAELGIIILALADPAATLVGKRWGRFRIWRDKSLVGTATFLATAMVIAFVYASIVQGGSALGSRFVFAIVVALTGTIAEVFTERLDDNFTIPVLCAGVASFWLVAG